MLFRQLDLMDLPGPQQLVEDIVLGALAQPADRRCGRDRSLLQNGQRGAHRGIHRNRPGQRDQRPGRKRLTREVGPYPAPEREVEDQGSGQDSPESGTLHLRLRRLVVQQRQQQVLSDARHRRTEGARGQEEWYGLALFSVTLAVLPFGKLYVRVSPSFAFSSAAPSGEFGE